MQKKMQKTKILEMKPAFKLRDAQMENTTSVDELAERVKVLVSSPEYKAEYQDQYKEPIQGWIQFLQDYTGVIGATGCNGNQISDKVKWESLLEDFLDKNWKNMTFKDSWIDLGCPDILIPD